MRRELVAGELRELNPAGSEHGEFAMRCGGRLAVYIEDHRLGVAYAAETGFILSRNPDTVRAPDFAFMSKDRAALIGRERGYNPGAPFLAIEVISPSEAYTEVEAKVGDWLRAGCRMVVVVNPRNRSLKVYRSQGGVTALDPNDVLDGGDILPGFQLPVKSVFVEE